MFVCVWFSIWLYRYQMRKGILPFKICNTNSAEQYEVDITATLTSQYESSLLCTIKKFNANSAEFEKIDWFRGGTLNVSLRYYIINDISILYCIAKILKVPNPYFRNVLLVTWGPWMPAPTSPAVCAATATIMPHHVTPPAANAWAAGTTRRETAVSAAPRVTMETRRPAHPVTVDHAPAHSPFLQTSELLFNFYSAKRFLIMINITFSWLSTLWHNKTTDFSYILKSI